MSMLWMADRAAKIREKRKKQNKCERCGQLYFKTEEKCPHCSELKDYQVKRALAKRIEFRLGLGKVMLLCAAGIILFMLFYKQ